MNPTLKRAATAPIRAVKALGQIVFSRASGLAWRLMPNSRFNYAREVGDRTGSSVIMAPLLWMARTFPGAPVQVLQHEKEGPQPVDRHPMVQLIRRPNAFYSGVVLWMATLLSFVVDGNAYWVKVRNGMGGVVELWWVPHWAIQPVGTTTALVDHYDYTVDGVVYRLDIDDLVHFRYGLDPDNPRKGLSPLNSVLREVFTDDEAANFSASLLHNLGVPGLLISPDGDHTISPDEADAAKAFLEEQFTGDRRGKPLVQRGKTKVQTFGFSPEQMTLRELRRIPEERVTAVLGLPAIVAGLGAGLDRSTFANYAEAREAAYEDNIIPTQRLFSEDLRHQLLGDFEDRVDNFEVGFDLSGVRVLQDDRNKEAERNARLYTAGLIKRSEGRLATGHDADPGDDVYAVPINTLLVPAGQAPPSPIPDPETRARGRKNADQAGLLLVQQFDRQAVRLADVWTTELEGHFAALGDQVATAYLRLGLASRNGHTKTDDEPAPDPAEVERIMLAAGVGLWADRTLTASFQTHWQRVADTTIDTINTILSLGVDLPDETARALVAQGGRRVGLVDVEASTRDALFRILAETRADGLGADATARVIRDQVPAGRFSNAGPQYRARLIARTETKFAQNVSSLAAYRTTDVVVGVRAFDGRLGDSDEDCLLRNGQVFTTDEADRISEEEHPNGTLSWAPVTRELIDA